MNVDEFTTSHPAEKDEHVIAVKSSLHYNAWYDRGKVIKIYYTSLDEKLFTIQTNQQQVKWIESVQFWYH